MVGDDIKCYNCKIVVYGTRGKDKNEAGVGKSRIINRYLESDYHFDYEEETERLYKSKQEELPGNCMIDYMIFDTSGSYQNLSLSDLTEEEKVTFKKNFDFTAAVMVYDVTNERSFKRCLEQIKNMRLIKPDIDIYVAGNKTDMPDD